MRTTDHHGHELTGASSAAADLYVQAIQTYHGYWGQPFPLLSQALADSPGFVMAHALKGYMTLMGSNVPVRQIGLAAYAAAHPLAATPREAAHVTAVGKIAAGEFRAAGRILEDIAIDHPTDVLALQAGQSIDFLVGDTRMLRDRISRVMPAWSPDMPDFHAILGLQAFGLEETGDYGRAEAAGRRGVELEPRNGWAQHAVAHVMEMQDRRADGIAWMNAGEKAWSRNSFFAIHNSWHLALFHLGLDDIDAVLALYDGPIYGARSPMMFDMDDAAALLWRLKLRGIDVGDRWTVLADAYALHPQGRYAFDDVHALMAFEGAGREAEADAVLVAMIATIDGPGDNAAVTRDVGLPIAQAIRAYARGAFGEAVELLRNVRNQAARFGGSHAQRDVLDLTLIAAAERSGEGSLARALRSERALAFQSST